MGGNPYSVVRLEIEIHSSAFQRRINDALVIPSYRAWSRHWRHRRHGRCRYLWDFFILWHFCRNVEWLGACYLHPLRGELRAIVFAICGSVSDRGYSFCGHAILRDTFFYFPQFRSLKIQEFFVAPMIETLCCG